MRMVILGFSHFNQSGYNISLINARQNLNKFVMNTGIFIKAMLTDCSTENDTTGYGISKIAHVNF